MNVVDIECAQIRRFAGRLMAVAISALIAGGSLAWAAPATADPSGTVKTRTQRMTEPSLSAQQDGWYNVGDSVALQCAVHGQPVSGFFSSSISNGGWDPLWYRTADGRYVADVDIDTGTLDSVAPACAPQPSSAGSAASPVVSTARALGKTQASNPGSDGQCTWGAAQKWFEASGSYPALRGDALGWRESAIAAGWTVVDEARDRSIVVFNPGVAGASSLGHVAWVDSVYELPEGRWIHITEMNNSQLGGVGIFNDRDVRDVPGMSYILLP